MLGISIPTKCPQSKSKTYVPLGDAPYAAILDNDNSIIVVTSSSLLRITPKGEAIKMIDGAFWGDLYPNSIVVDFNRNAYIGMRQGVARVSLSKSEPEIAWLVPSKAFLNTEVKDKVYPMDTTLKTILTSSEKHSVSSVVISFEVINTGKKATEICIYQTPLEHKVTTKSMFHVTDAKGREVEYTGIQAKRRPPSRKAGDYIVLQPGKSAGASIDLVKSFSWVPGKFNVTFVGNRFLNKLPQSNTVTITIEP